MDGEWGGGEWGSGEVAMEVGRWITGVERRSEVGEWGRGGGQKRRCRPLALGSRCGAARGLGNAQWRRDTDRRPGGGWRGRERVMRVAKHKKSAEEGVRRRSCGWGEEEWGREGEVGGGGGR